MRTFARVALAVIFTLGLLGPLESAIGQAATQQSATDLQAYNFFVESDNAVNTQTTCTLTSQGSTSIYLGHVDFSTTSDATGGALTGPLLWTLTGGNVTLKWSQTVVAGAGAMASYNSEFTHPIKAKAAATNFVLTSPTGQTHAAFTCNLGGYQAT